ncbi:transglycosylase SLT domain-containing protein [Shewanella aquimarina]|uniref:transglycosylase SLT domain-containing protein n=1 Tax=Shewanella aquimarina TaxID=260365 RepID=UPI002014EEC2|nr:transglycosylase SLT domain-containing protein [Shewanella aquimarina]MCL2909285.1 transglycosylase SLT domain-containing protein [Shewanella aquimarina]
MPKRLGTLFQAKRYLLIGLGALIPMTLSAASLTQNQQRYLDAREALDNGKLERYQTLRAQLNGYPLIPYLDYHAEIDNILAAPGSEARKAMARFDGTPLYNSARHRYLESAGKTKRWQDFLAISPEVPRSISLQCYYYRAQLSQGDKAMAFDGAKKLWLHGHSRPKECDPLFTAWEKAGHRSQSLLWSRMLMAFNGSEYSLLKYLASKVTAHQKEAKQLLAVYQDPRTLRHTKRFKVKAAIYGDIVDAGLRRLARKDLIKAVSLFQKYEKAHRFSDYQAQKLARYLMKRALIAQETELKAFVDNRLPKTDSDDLKTLRLRWAIREADNKSLDKYLPLLSESKRQKARWQYWIARRQMETGTKVADTALPALSKQRNFYGFTAADLVSTTINLAQIDTQPDDKLTPLLAQDPGLARVEELLALDKKIDARAEWVLLLGRHPQQKQAQYALLASRNKWHDLTVQASIQGQLWNDMTLRFPYAAEEAFKAASKNARVDIDEIRAIARRESAFYPYATSGVGARGLMQLMPATAKETARKHGIKYRGSKSLYDVSLNTGLGSRYYKSLLDRFDGNRVLATAAYNAGPHRVTRWLERSQGKLDVFAFIESIPFTETREYVQAVLSYRVIYQAKQQKPVALFSSKELAFKY